MLQEAALVRFACGTVVWEESIRSCTLFAGAALCGVFLALVVAGYVHAVSRRVTE